MTNNDVLRRIRYTFDFNDPKMVKIFAMAGHEVTREQVSSWLKKDDDPEFENCSDVNLAAFRCQFVQFRHALLWNHDAVVDR